MGVACRFGCVSQFGVIGGPHDTSAGGVTTGTSRRARAATLVGVAAATGYVFLADPDNGGAYPLCPSRTLFGIDCPACGGLRGTNALLHGRVAEALDHNLLLPLLLGFMAVALGLWLLPLVGRGAPTIRAPRWLTFAAIGLFAAFTLVRNLPVDGLEFLASDA